MAQPNPPGAMTFPCSACGAQLAYDAAAQALKCPYCGAQQQVAGPGAGAAGPREIPIEEGLARAARGLGAPATSIDCQECGARVNVAAGEQTAKCSFCGSHKVLPHDADPNLVRPESLLPFGFDQRKANDLFGAWLGKLWFRPGDLKQMARVNEMRGVYVPFWTFDSQVESSWTAEAGYHYYETEWTTEERDGQTVQVQKQVQKTRWEPAWGRRLDAYDDVLVCASKGLPQDLVDRFVTFDTKQLVAYQPGFLAGWVAESYAIDLQPSWQRAMAKIADEQRRRCARDVPGDTHRNLSVTDRHSAVTFKHVLLPVWIAAYQYGNKPYRFLINGQTGEVVGKAPYSFWKIFLFVALIVAVVAGIAIAVHLSRTRDDAARSTGKAEPTSVQPQPTRAATPAPRPTPAPLKKK